MICSACQSGATMRHEFPVDYQWGARLFHWVNQGWQCLDCQFVWADYAQRLHNNQTYRMAR